MEFLIVLFFSFIGLLILAIVIRYAIDSSKTSKTLEELTKEVRYLRNDIKKNISKQDNNKNIIDEKV